MPTPFYHLSLGIDLLQHSGLPDDLRGFLNTMRGAFLLGHTAPDVQTVSMQKRQETHFFNLPVRHNDPPPWKCILEEHPALLQAGQLSPEQAVFIAGYLCHLQADWHWVRQIYAPVFGPSAGWRDLRHRHYLHNVLRTQLDLQSLPDLGPQVADELAEAKPVHWLPFVQDCYLGTWRELLCNQLCEGCEPQTVQVFAARGGISTKEFYNLLNSAEEMEQQIYSRVTHREIENYREELLIQHLQLMTNYLNPIYCYWIA